VGVCFMCYREHFIFSHVGQIQILKNTHDGELRYLHYSTGLFEKKYTLSKIYFTKTTDAKFMFCVQIEMKSLKVLISMI
jgi:hypothetical protein